MGLCIGVKRALSLLDGICAKNRGKTLYAYGELAHNSHVIRYVESLGFRTIIDASEAEEGSVVLVRAHGISDSERSKLESNGVEIVDATCPLVAKNQNIMRNSEYPVVVFGIKGHSETLAVEGAAKGEYYVVEDKEDICQIPKDRKYRIIVQTTFETEKCKELMHEMERQGYQYAVSNSVCMASEMRRKAIRDLNGRVDILIVVGDRKSANSNALVAEARSIGLRSELIEDASDVDPHMFDGLSVVGISAGSSTPDDVIDEVVRRIESI